MSIFFQKKEKRNIGEIIYEDDFQIAIKNQRTDISITTEKI